MIKALFKRKNYGLLELLIASIIIICQYRLGPIPMSFVLCPFIIILAHGRKKGVWRMRAFIFFVLYFILHESALFITMAVVPSYHLNLFLGITLFLVTILFAVPALNYRKLIVSISLIGIIVSLGILYHFVIIRLGGTVRTIQIPFLPSNQDFGQRILSRPTSFFTEPSYYGVYMMVPFFLSLSYKKYWLSTLCTFMVFLSTTITGVIGCFCITCVYVFNRRGRKMVSLILIPIIVMVMGYVLISFEIFGETASKIETQSTNVETVDRVYNGILLFDKIEKEYLILGVNNSNCSDYVNEKHLLGYLIPLFEGSNLIYLSSFWEILFKFGIVGLLLYFSVYLTLYKKEKTLLPYIASAVVSMFFGGDGLMSFYVYSISFMGVYSRSFMKTSIASSHLISRNKSITY